MSLFHHPTHEPLLRDDEPHDEPDGETNRLAHTILLLVTALLIWSIASRPLQFLAHNDTAQHCVHFGRAGANCSAAAHPDAAEPHR